MASEMGIDPKMAKRAGLLHDMGKVPSIEKGYRNTTCITRDAMGRKIWRKTRRL